MTPVTKRIGTINMTVLERIGTINLCQKGNLFATVARVDGHIERLWFTDLDDARDHAMQSADLVDGLDAIVH